MLDYRFFSDKKPNIFYRVPSRLQKDLKTAVIIFNQPFVDGRIDTSQELFNNSMVSVFSLLSETKLFGYAIAIPTVMKHRSIGSSMLSASKKKNIGMPNEVKQIFSANNFSIFSDDLEQAVLCSCRYPSIVDVTKG